MRAGATAFATTVLVIGRLNRALIEPIKALAPASTARYYCKVVPEESR